MDDQDSYEYLKPGEVASILHVSPKTVNRWAKEGRIPCILTLGGHQRFLRRDVASAVAKMTSGLAPREEPAPRAKKAAPKRGGAKRA